MKKNKPTTIVQTYKDKPRRKRFFSKLVSYFKQKPAHFVIPAFLLVATNLVFSISLSAGHHQLSTPHINTVANTLSATVKPAPQKLTEKEMLVKAVENLVSSNSVRIDVSGQIKSFVTQKLDAVRIFDGTTYFCETKTSGFKSNATRIYAENGKVKTIKATDKAMTKFTARPLHYTYKEFEDRFGVVATEFLPYNINDLTIVTTTKSETSNGNTTFTATLHPTLATPKYVKNMQKLAKLKHAPVFKNVELTVTLDENNNFKTVVVNEEFFVKMFGMDLTAKSSQNITFDFSKKPIIP